MRSPGEDTELEHEHPLVDLGAAVVGQVGELGQASDDLRQPPLWISWPADGSNLREWRSL
jgi:hypothetical protein